MINRNIMKTSCQEVKTAKSEGSNIEQILLPSRIHTKYRAYVSVRLKREFEEEINKTPTEEVNQERIPLTAKKEMNHSPVLVADYEQELYEKDQYIQALENEIRGLKGSIYCLREKIL